MFSTGNSHRNANHLWDVTGNSHNSAASQLMAHCQHHCTDGALPTPQSWRNANSTIIMAQCQQITAQCQQAHHHNGAMPAPQSWRNANTTAMAQCQHTTYGAMPAGPTPQSWRNANTTIIRRTANRPDTTGARHNSTMAQCQHHNMAQCQHGFPKSQ